MTNPVTENSHTNRPSFDNQKAFSSLSQRVPNQVNFCSMVSPKADEENTISSQKNNHTMKKAASKKAAKVAPDMYQVITNRIIEQLEKGTLPWRKTWSSYGLAKNYVSGKTYKGINMLMMNFFSPHAIPYYLTFNQVKELGGRVKNGAKAEQVIFFKMLFKDKNDNTISKEAAETAEGVKVLKFLKYYNVFNVADIEGIEFKFEEVTLKANEKIERCEQVINNYPNPPKYVFEDVKGAYYVPTEADFINMPPIEYHDDSEAYYATFFHELIHSTGHAKRLAREEVVTPNKFGTIPYSEEELVAELGASFLCGVAGIDRDPIIENAAAYIGGWLKKLKDDKNFIFKAAAEAQKAVDFIIGSTFEEVEAEAE